MIQITYLSHSGFVLDFTDKTLVFDYYKGNLRKYLTKEKEVIFFVSHAHFDHFRKDIFAFANDYQASYILSDDIKAEKEENRLFVRADQNYDFKDMKIRTLKSTDEGVAFCLKIEDYDIFYAGDLNLWCWQEEGEQFNQKMTVAYQQEIEKIKAEKFDLAFFPLDPRQKEDFYLGLDYFMKKTNTQKVVPMHMWGKYEYIDKLLALPKASAYRDKIVKITKEEQSFSIE